MHSKWRWFTKAARREQFEDQMDARFRAYVRTMSMDELNAAYAHIAAKLSRTHARYIYVRQRLEFKLGVMRGEILTRSTQKTN